ncbi:MAG: type IV pilin protein [Pseudomonadota bacterium]
MRSVSIMSRSSKSTGFTLIEVLIAVAIVGILSAIAYPSYSSYVQRGRLIEASNTLLALRTSMEQYYQDNRGYANASSTIISPCDTSRLPVLKEFTYTCVIGTPASGFTATATGKTPLTNGFEYRIDSAGTQSSTMSTEWGGGSFPCWIMKKGDACT